MENSFHMYLSSEDSRQTFPLNSAVNFSCLLPERLQLTNRGWWCALLELRLPAAVDEPLYLCSNICNDSVAKLPILARIGAQLTQPNHVVYVPVKIKELSVVQLYLYDRFEKLDSLSSGTSYCTIRICNHEALRHNA